MTQAKLTHRELCEVGSSIVMWSNEMLEKFIKYCQAKNENCSENYLTHVFNNSQDLNIVQFLNEEVKLKTSALKERNSEIEKLELKISEDSRILHNVIDIERKKNDALQKRVDDSIFILSTIDTPDEAYKLIDSLLRTLKGTTNELEQVFNKEVSHG
ncbi:hypothetical protein J522_1926 [Acinetobacter baumannii 146457]|nr:hypothetical protein J522_1926 [Acinetobacter baumannii 146457]